MTIAAALDLATELLRQIPDPDILLRRARVRGRLRAERVRLRARIARRTVPPPGLVARLERVDTMIAALEAA